MARFLRHHPLLRTACNVCQTAAALHQAHTHDMQHTLRQRQLQRNCSSRSPTDTLLLHLEHHNSLNHRRMASSGEATRHHQAISTILRHKRNNQTRILPLCRQGRNNNSFSHLEEAKGRRGGHKITHLLLMATPSSKLLNYTTSSRVLRAARQAMTASSLVLIPQSQCTSAPGAAGQATRVTPKLRACGASRA